jgi:hypothetical protein
MGEESGRGWSKTGVLFAIATFGVAFATFWLTFVIGYTGSPGFGAWVDSVVEALGPLAAKMVAGLVSGFVGVVASVLMNWAKGRAEQSNWRSRWRQWCRERYASALYCAAKPVREDLAARFAAHYASAAREGAGAESPWRARVRGLTKVAAEVLYRVLKWRVTYPGDDVHVPLREIAAWPGQLSQYDMDIVEDACRELEAANFLSSAGCSGGGGVLHVVLDDGVKDIPAARELMAEINGWMVECGYWQ